MCIYKNAFGNHTIGVYDWEQTIEQKLVFDIEMAWDNRKSAKSDDVTQIVGLCGYPPTR